MKIYAVKIASGHHELTPFMDYLTNQGHDVSVSDNESSYLNGVCTHDDIDSRHILNVMWDNYYRIQ